MASDASQPVEAFHYLLIGNSGVGKGTILNRYLRGVVFETGLHFGDGRTYSLETYVDERGNTFARVPGLATNGAREGAAAATTQALRLGGHFRIFFVVQLRHCRVLRDDVESIKLVLDAAPITAFGIIINQASLRDWEELVLNPKRVSPSPLSQVQHALMCGLGVDQRTCPMFVAPYEPEVDGREDVLWPLLEGLREFIDEQTVVEIPPEAVVPVRTDLFAGMREKLVQLIERLLAETGCVQEKTQSMELQQDIDRKWCDQVCRDLEIVQGQANKRNAMQLTYGRRAGSAPCARR